jgi:hypothetical protein
MCSERYFLSSDFAKYRLILEHSSFCMPKPLVPLKWSAHPGQQGDGRERKIGEN